MAVIQRKRGITGEPQNVYSNSFVVTRLPTKRFYQYDVISPEPKHPRQAQEIMDRLQTHTAPIVFTPKGVYDGKSILFVSHLLKFPGNSGNFTVSMSDRPPRPGVPPRGIYNVRLTHTSADTIDFSSLAPYINGQARPSARTLSAINLLQLLIRAAPNLMYPHNLKAYYSDIGKQRINGGFELWSGYFQSVRPSLGRMLVNIDISMTAMYASGPLRDVALSAIGSRDTRALEVQSGHPDFRKLKNFFKGVRVEINPTGAPGGRTNKKIIRDIVPTAGRFNFDKDGIQTSVSTYFQQTHRYTVRYPNEIGIDVGRRDSPAVFPMEVCRVVPGQIYKKKVPSNLTKDVVDFATKKPQDRLSAITSAPQHGATGMTAPVFEYATSPFMKDAGMEVSSRPITIKGRILPTPQLSYAGDQPVRISDGAWNVMSAQFRKPKNLVAWAVVNFSPRDKPKVVEFVSMMKSCFNQLNMKHLQPYVLEGNGQGNISAILQDISETAVNQAREQIQLLPPNTRPPPPTRPDLIFCILPHPADEIRRAVKHFGDVEQGIPTQCIRGDKLKSKGLNQYCNNVALKVNIRLGGENSKTSSKALSELQKQPFMIVGADVGHPGAGVQNQPSIAGLVWSYDFNAMKYAALSRVQSARQESIEDLQEMMEEALDAFGSMQMPPARIVFYRDGLSEGEFEGVGAQEIKAIQDAIDAVWERKRAHSIKKPMITYIVVGKRHHIRFFPLQPTAGDRKSGNCRAGFVADEGIDSPIAADFYLLSHGGLLGTSRPSHYTILRDDIYGNNPDALQQLSFTLCHCFARATRSVSIPAPVYYADLVCERAKFHFDPALRYDDEGTVSSGDGRLAPDLTPWRNGYRPLHLALRRSMYFL